MAITVTSTPVTLRWSDFTSSRNLPAGEDAHIDSKVDVPVRTPRPVDGQWALAETFAIAVTPRARVRAGANQTAALLAHEQGHYDLAILAARKLARALAAIRAANQAALRAPLQAAFTLHISTRLGTIQTRYDTDTAHSTNVAQQTRWAGLISAALAATACDNIDSLPF